MAHKTWTSDGKHSIFNNVNGPWIIHASDVDDDGDIDVLSVNEHDNTIVWYSNNGNQMFKPKIIASNVSNVWTLYTTDVNTDGNVDIITGTEGNNIIISAHGNSIRAIVMDIFNLSPEQILKTEIGWCEPWVISFDNDGKIFNYQIIKRESEPSNSHLSIE